MLVQLVETRVRRPALDPTDNSMDYSGDACWTNFTAGQNDRMASMFAIYRFGQ
jgi:hypothetical protein